MIIPVILQILKIIGIVLLVLIGIVLLLVLLVLFVPIRYKVSFVRTGMEDDPPVDAVGRISWLLHIVHISAAFKTPEDFAVVLRIFGIPVFRLPAPEGREADKKKDKKKKKEEEIPVESEISPAEDSEPEQISPENMADEDPDIASPEDITEDEADEEGSESIFSRIAGTVNKIKCTIQDTYDKITNGVRDLESNINKVKKEIHYYHTILTSELFERTFEKCKKKLYRLFRELRPKKCDVNARVGFDDPYTTGEVMAIAGILYPIIGQHVHIAPDFEEVIISANGILKGRIFVFSLARLGIFYLTDRDLKKLIRLFRKQPVKKKRSKAVNHKEELQYG